MANGLVRELRSAAPGGAMQLPVKDARAAERLVRGRLLRWEAMRRVLGVGTLFVLGVGSVLGAIFTALRLKLAVKGHTAVGLAWGQTKTYAPLACLVTALLFARSDLYADRAVRPGLARIVASLFQVTLLILVFTIVQGQSFMSYYIFYASLLFALIYVSGARWLFDRASGALLHASGYTRRSVLVGTGPQIEALSHAPANEATGQVNPVSHL